jgi:hypothetical protein
VKWFASKASVFGGSFLRYVSAVYFAFSLTLFVVALWLIFMKFKAPVAFGFMDGVAGFVAVFVASYVLPRQSRITCSIFLLALGVAFNLFILQFGGMIYGKDWLEFPYSLLRHETLGVVCGGVIGVVLHCLFSRQKKSESNPIDDGQTSP